MKIATLADAESIYRRLEPLAQEVFDIPSLPPLVVERTIGTSLAVTDFFNTRTFTLAKNAQKVAISGVILGITYMDEMEMILRHEIAHVAAGLRAGHGWWWKACCEKFETLPAPSMTLRNNQEFARRIGYLSMESIGTMDAHDFDYSWL